ncbi:MAG: InlB B-repeat-containing protein, partial [Candidatus Bathyarchaeota archaeon]|nr:InlB B-repeat-containing protein [Candidatus Termiticorpusculum sp.]
MFNKKINKTLKLNTHPNLNYKINLPKLHHKHTIFTLISLIFTLMLLSSIVYTATTFNHISPFTSAYTADETVNTEQTLRNAIKYAPTTASPQYVIALTEDIELTGSTLTIPANANIVLINAKNTPTKLVGPNDINTITIASKGKLILDGITVTHNSDTTGRGVYVDYGATLTLNSGEISENNIYTGGIIKDATFGGGVYNLGTFTLNGGTLHKNSAYNGGGVYNLGTFEMNKGTFSENTASGAGGGVDNLGTFEMNGGLFYKNVASNGGGVLNAIYAAFTLTDGQFLENQAGQGGGIYNDAFSTFTLIDGTFSKNKAVMGGGVYNLGIIKLFGGVIGGATVADGNIATESGGGVCNDGFFSDFSMHDGIIAHNTADYGGGVESAAGVFNMFGGKISYNTALRGGGACIWSPSTFIMEGGVLFGNTASYEGGGVYNRAYFAMSDNAVIANNTAKGYGNIKGYGGGVYNAGADAVFNMNGGVIGGSNNDEDNFAYRGGGVYNADGTTTMSGNAVILGNKASFGGGVYNDGGVFNMGETFSSELVCILNNMATSYGGGVYNVGVNAFFNMFDNAVISGNSASGDGGGVYTSATFNLFGGEISDNAASSGGGGVYTSGEFNMYDGKISYNFAGTGGGGVLNYRIFNMFDGEISSNTAKTHAGGVQNNGSGAGGSTIFSMSGNAVISNNAAIAGGGVFNAYGAIFNMFEQAMISGNTAVNALNTDGRGGGVRNNDRGVFNMFDNAVILDNFAVYGGGVFNDGNCVFTMSDAAAILNNSASSYGGGVYNWSPYDASTQSTFTLTDNAVISGNSANYGGGVQNTVNGLFILSGNAVISDNSAIYEGGGIYTISTLPNAVTIKGGAVVNNSASYGGGVYAGSDLVMIGGVIANNTATVNGGGVYMASNGFFKLLAGMVYGNVAGNNGGGIWVTDTDDVVSLEMLYIESGVVFKDNKANVLVSLTELSVYEEGVYRSQVNVADGAWSNGVLYGINNYDISFMSMCVIVYAPGTQGTWSAETETFGDLVFGSYTPAFGSLSGADYSVEHVGGYVFTGWLPVWSSTVLGNVTYVAQWSKVVEPMFYSVVYVGNGFTGGVVPVDTRNPYASGSVVLVQGSGSMVREGYTFLGWAPSFDADTAVYVEGSAFSIFKDTTLYAVWTQEPTFTVTYKPGTHGSFTDFTNEPELVYTVAAGGLTPKTPLVVGETGWQFTGWNPTPSTTVTKDATYIAQWKPNTHGVIYDANGGNNAPIDNGIYHAGDTVTVLPNIPTRTGYTFTGWLYNTA